MTTKRELNRYSPARVREQLISVSTTNFCPSSFSAFPQPWYPKKVIPCIRILSDACVRNDDARRLAIANTGPAGEKRTAAMRMQIPPFLKHEMAENMVQSTKAFYGGWCLTCWRSSEDSVIAQPTLQPRRFMTSQQINETVLYGFSAPGQESPFSVSQLAYNHKRLKNVL